MSKRKRQENVSEPAVNGKPAKVTKTDHAPIETSRVVLQIVAGSYEKTLHGVSCTVADFPSKKASCEFADTFLFNAHSSAIKCLAVSPLSDPTSHEAQTVLLASGGSDERINVYSLSASPMSEGGRMPAMPSIAGGKLAENPRNRELGSLVHHSSGITSLHFPTRSKLLSGSEDNTISVSRTRDLSVVSTIKAPRPKAQGQPSGDTNPVGATPAGINDFSIHPSMKVMLSIGKGERCMRLWNLVTGKKAGILNFSRDVLRQIKEGKYSSSEGRRIAWNPKGTEFAVAFERGIVLFGEDSKPRRKILPQPLTKIHQMKYLELPSRSGFPSEVLVVSTESGKLLFYSIKNQDVGTEVGNQHGIEDAELLYSLNGAEAGTTGRIKDFKIIQPRGDGKEAAYVIATTAGSDGSIKIWSISTESISKTHDEFVEPARLIGMFQTGSRITCLEAFEMLPVSGDDEAGLSEFEGLTETSDIGEDDDSEIDIQV